MGAASGTLIRLVEQGAGTTPAAIEQGLVEGRGKRFGGGVVREAYSLCKGASLGLDEEGQSVSDGAR